MAKPGPKPRITVREARDLYRQAQEGDRLAEGTIKKHRGVIGSLLVSLGRDLQLASVERGHIATWRRERSMTLGRQGKPLSVGTLNNDRVILATFWKWCRENGHCKGALPTEGMKKIEGFASEHHHVPAERWPEFLDAAENPRDRFGIAIGLYTFARASEINSAVVGDLQPFADGFPGIKITRWKTKEVDHLEIVEEFQEEIDRWLEFYRRQLAAQGIELSNEHRLVPSFQHGHKIQQGPDGKFSKVKQLVPHRSPARMAEMVQPALLAMGYTTLQEGMHTCRRSGALAYLNDLNYRVDTLREILPNPPIRIVMDLLGHKDQRTTEKYLGLAHGRTARNQVMRGRRMIERDYSPTPAEPIALQPAPVRHLSVVRAVG